MRELFRLMALLVACCALVYAWLVQRENRRLREEKKDLVSAQQEIIHAANRPVLIRGFSLPLSDEVVEVVRERRAGQKGKRLIIIFDSTCHACKAQLPVWEAMLSDPRMKQVETWLVSLDGKLDFADRLVHVLNDKFLPFRLMRVRQRLPFVVSTGISYSPTIILTEVSNEGQRVLFVVTGSATADHCNVVLEGISSGQIESAHILAGLGGSPIETPR
ncbi:MAG: hypothetical protein ABSE21_11635 [Bryobacteraceae bacterium]